MTSGPGQEPEPEPDEPRSKRTAPKFTVAYIGGGVLTAVGALAAGAQLLDYIQSGKLNLIASAFFAGLAALGIVGLLARKDRKAVAIGASGTVLVFAAAFTAVALARASSSAPPYSSTPSSTPPVVSTAPSSPISNAPGNSGDEGSSRNSPPEAPRTVQVNLEVLTSEYQRANRDGTEYRVYPSTGKLDFRYGWAAHTENGDLKTADCSINSRILRSDGVVVQSSVDNDCSLIPGQHGKSLEPGTYVVEVNLEYGNQPTITETKQVTVLPA